MRLLQCVLIMLSLSCLSVGSISAEDTTVDSAAVAQQVDTNEVKSIYVGIDQSRSSADKHFLDRLRLITDTLLPSCQPTTVVTVDSDVMPVADNRIGELRTNARNSDYLVLFDDAIVPQLASDTPPRLIMLAGDGCVEAVDKAMNPAYLEWAVASQSDQTAKPTRDIINRAVTQHVTNTHTSLPVNADVFWLVLDPNQDTRTTSLWPWLVNDGSHAARVIAGAGGENVFLKGVLSSLIKGGVLDADTVIRTDKTNGQLIIPEGCEQADVYVTVKELGSEIKVTFDGRPLAIIVPGDEAPESGVWAQWVDRSGVARCLEIHNCIDGGVLALAGDIYESYGIIKRSVEHSMQVEVSDGIRGVFMGELVGIRHSFVRSDGKDISETLQNQLMDQIALDMNGVGVADPLQLTLPDTEGVVVVSARFPLASWVHSTPLEINPLGSDPMRLTGGWHTDTVFAGEPVTLSFVRSGGRFLHSDIKMIVTSSASNTNIITLEPSTDNPDLYRATAATTDAWIETWTLPAEVDCGTELAQVVIAHADGHTDADIAEHPGAQRHKDLTVEWDWRLAALIGALIALLLLALFLWWFLTRPKWADELVYHNGVAHRLNELPGPKKRNTSYGVEGLSNELLLTKTRKGLELSRTGDGVHCYVNGQPQSLDQPLAVAAGNDIETVKANGTRTHVRLFDSEDEASSWSAEQAQIDLDADFECTHFIIEPDTADTKR